MLIRGFYYEGWHLPGAPVRLRHKEDFLNYVNGDIFRGLGVDPERGVRAVFSVMSSRLDAGGIEKLVKLFPEELRELWPAARGAAPARAARHRGGEISLRKTAVWSRGAMLSPDVSRGVTDMMPFVLRGPSGRR